MRAASGRGKKTAYLVVDRKHVVEERKHVVGMFLFNRLGKEKLKLSRRSKLKTPAEDRGCNRVGK
jgi:hypothetical protein